MSNPETLHTSVSVEGKLTVPDTPIINEALSIVKAAL